LQHYCKFREIDDLKQCSHCGHNVISRACYSTLQPSAAIECVRSCERRGRSQKI